MVDTHIYNLSSRSEASRKPKLFYVTTKSSTSTLSTFSICFVSSDAAPVTCKRRKKRADIVKVKPSEEVFRQYDKQIREVWNRRRMEDPGWQSKHKASGPRLLGHRNLQNHRLGKLSDCAIYSQ